MKSLKLPKGGNQNLYIEEDQTTQCPTDTKGVIRIRISKKNRQYIGQKDTKGVIRIRISKKNRQHSGQKEKCKRTNNDLQNIHIQLHIE